MHLVYNCMPCTAFIWHLTQVGRLKMKYFILPYVEMQALKFVDRLSSVSWNVFSFLQFQNHKFNAQQNCENVSQEKIVFSRNSFSKKQDATMSGQSRKHADIECYRSPSSGPALPKMMVVVDKAYANKIIYPLFPMSKDRTT